MTEADSTPGVTGAKVTEFLKAESDMRQLQARYIDAVWRKDFDAFGDCFTEDAEWRIGGQVMRGRAECVGLLKAVMPAIDRVFMTMGVPLLQLEAGDAIARTYVNEMKTSKNAALTFSIGIYYDRCREEDGQWRFAWHHYQSYYHGPGDLSAPFRHIIDYGPPWGMPAPDENAPTAGPPNFGKTP